jgi:hypothetical protein
MVAMTAEAEVDCERSEDGVRGPNWSRTDSLVGVDRADDDEAPKGARGCGKTSLHADKGLDDCGSRLNS